LDLKNINFVQSTILNSKIDATPNMVIALHACNIATDESIVKALSWNSKYILLAPCCHHDIMPPNEDLKNHVLHPIIKNKSFKIKLNDMVTDTLRQLIIGIYGYKTEVCEFVSDNHTNRNLIIKCVKFDIDNIGVKKKLISDYLSLKKFWGVTPNLEILLGTDFKNYINKYI
jgi:hypothetical protein